MSAVWFNPYKGVPIIIFQPIQWKLSLFIWICNTYIPTNIFTDQSEESHSHQLGQCFLDQSHCEDFESSSAYEWTNPGSGAGLLSIEVSSQLAQGVHFPLHGRLCFPGWSWNTEDISLVWTGVEQSCLAGDGLHSRATLPEGPPCCSTAMLYYNWVVMLLSCLTTVLFCKTAVSQLSCLHWMEFPSLPRPSWIFLLALHWHQWPVVGNTQHLWLVRSVLSP